VTSWQDERQDWSYRAADVAHLATLTAPSSIALRAAVMEWKGNRDLGEKRKQVAVDQCGTSKVVYEMPAFIILFCFVIFWGRLFIVERVVVLLCPGD